MNKLIWFALGGAGLVLIAGGAGLLFLKTTANGFSARAEPSSFETFAARTARGLAMPANAKNRQTQ